jgi:hypothetical protein
VSREGGERKSEGERRGGEGRGGERLSEGEGRREEEGEEV